jgi:hypothetical protein
MAKVSAIHEQLAKLLVGQLSLDDFENWFVPYSWNIHKLGDHDAQQLAYAVEHQLSEFDEDCEALRLGLEDAVRPFGHAENRYGDPSPIPVPEFNAALEIRQHVLA